MNGSRYLQKFPTATVGILGALGLAVLATPAPPENPILPGADPYVLWIDNTVWIYPTWSDRPRERFYAFSSTNLVDWKRHGPVLDLADVTWVPEDGQSRHHAWAPGVLHEGNRFYFYYSVGPQNPTPSRIGVALGDSPDGPFIDSGRPLLIGGNGFEAIDPMVYRDPKSGKAYLYAGGSAGATLRVFELNTDRISLAREIAVQTPPHFTEAPFIHEYDGHYYLSYSHGSYNRASYSVHYAKGESPVGPWVYQGRLLASDAIRKGPGHHAFIRDPATGQWWIFYHRWQNAEGEGPYRGMRQICVEPIEYDTEGRILPIQMTGSRPAGPEASVSPRQEPR